MKNSDFHTFDNHKRHGFVDDIAASLAFLTRLPIDVSYVRNDIASAVRGFGVVGLIVGALCGLVFWFITAVGISPTIAGFLGIGTGFLVTGGLHEDGLGDVADGFGGGWTRERKLEIMRDSSIGTYGILALVVFTAIRALGVGEIIGGNAGLIQCIFIFAGIGCISRTPMVLMMYQLNLARNDGRAVEAGKPSLIKTQTAIGFGVGVSFLLFWIGLGLFSAALCIGAIISAYYIVQRIANAQIGGYTGDVLGFLQQLSELLLILSFLAVI